MGQDSWLKHASSLVSAIALLSLLGANLDLGYLVETLVENYRRLRDLIWFPINLMIDVPPGLRDMLTFWGVFIPAFILRGNSHNNIAAISFVGSTVLMLLLGVLMLICQGIEWATGFFSWIDWVQTSDEASTLAMVVVWAMTFAALPLLMFICGVMYGWFYWWLVFLFPHLGTAIQLFAQQIDSEFFNFVRNHFILLPYQIGCECLRLAGFQSRIVVDPDALNDQEPEWMSVEETKRYYLPVRDVFIAFFALLLLSKVLFDSV